MCNLLEHSKPAELSDILSFKRKWHSTFLHIKNAQEAGEHLIEKLIDDSKFYLSLKLSQRILCHDKSKFQYLEWNFINSDNAELQKLAIEHHRSLNPHHLAYFNGDCERMMDVDIAEWCCDVKARSSEMGTDLREYVNHFIKSRNISEDSNFCKHVFYFLDLMLEKPFEEI